MTTYNFHKLTQFNMKNTVVGYTRWNKYYRVQVRHRFIISQNKTPLQLYTHKIYDIRLFETRDQI